MPESLDRPERNLPPAPALPSGRAAVTRWVEDLLAVGVHSFTVEEARRAIGGTLDHVQVALSRLAASGRLVRPVKGFYVIVTPEHRSLGAPPPSWYIDPMMDHLDMPYYVALLSAAALYGAAPQAPQEFQVMTTQYRPAKTVGRARLRWVVKHDVKPPASQPGSASAVDEKNPVLRASHPAQRVNTPTGAMWVSTPETTAVDLVEYARHAGYLSHVASVLDALTDSPLDAAALTAACANRGPTARRLGYLLDTLGHQALANAVEAALIPRRRPSGVRPGAGSDVKTDSDSVASRRPVALSLGVPAIDAPLNVRWGILVNDTIEID